MEITKFDLIEISEELKNSKNEQFIAIKGKEIRKDSLLAWLLEWLKSPDVFGDSIIINESTKNPLITDFIDIMTEDACANLSNTPGMGAIVSAQPGAVPGTAGSIGSGDVSRLMNVSTQFGLPKKRRKRKKKAKSITEALDITEYKDMVSHLDKYSNKVGEMAIDRGKDIMEWISQYNNQFQAKEDIWVITEIKPALSALANKGLYIELKKGEKTVTLNISTGDENNPLIWKYDETKRETGGIKNFLEFLKN